MMSAGEALEEARAELKIPPAEFADAIGVSQQQLASAIGGDDEAGRAALRGAAEILGLDVAEMLNDGVAGRAATTMLRSFVENAHDSAFVEVLARGIHRELGRFARQVRRKAWLRDALSKPLPPMLDMGGARPVAPGSEPPHGADALAVEVRAELGLGDEPIPSMLALMRRLGVDVRFTGTLWSRIAGASVSTGNARGVLVNLAGNGRRWWRTRTTLAHELCHLLFDGGIFAGARGGPLLIFSPVARGYAPRFGEAHPLFLHAEQRANAFAAYFLAPPDAVRAMFPEGEPARTWEAVWRVASHFSLSDVTAVNLLTNVYGWSDQERYDLLDEIEGQWTPAREHPDVVAASPAEDPELRALADEAVAAGILFPSTRNRWLGVPAVPARGTPPAVPRVLTAEACVGEVRDLLGRGDVDAALRVLWDAADGWIDAADIDTCRALFGALPPVAVDGNVIVSLLAVTARAAELDEVRAAYRRDARRALQEGGRSPEEIAALLGEDRVGGG